MYLVPGLGAKRLDRLQVRDVRTWLNRLRITCQCCSQGKDAARRPDRRRCCAIGTCCQQVISDRTVKDVRDTLRAALTNAVGEELVTRNVAAVVRLPTPRRRQRQWWSVEEARAFLESARRDRDPLYAAYVLILVLGLRRGEALGLTWPDVSFDADEVHVRWQLQRARHLTGPTAGSRSSRG
jgi:integrase